MDNRTLARRLTDQADQLATEQGNLFHSRAYRRAAETVLRQDEPISEMVARQGHLALQHLPGIGRRISQKIADLLSQAN